MENPLLSIKPTEALDNFLNEYNNISTIDFAKSKELIASAIKDYDSAPYQKFLIDSWYDSLKINKPNYHLYNDKFYFTDLWVCWILYSRNYLRAITKYNSFNKDQSIYSVLSNINNVADLGCGIGYTTASLKQIFPNAQVYGTNIDNTDQYKFCERMSVKYNFKIVNSITNLPKIDFMFASEYYEHIYNVLDELEYTIKKLSPRFLYIANSFNTTSYGHFIFYKNLFDNKEVDQKIISKKFNNLLKKMGYVKLKTKLWNNKPSFWVQK